MDTGKKPITPVSTSKSPTAIDQKVVAAKLQSKPEAAKSEIKPDSTTPAARDHSATDKKPEAAAAAPSPSVTQTTAAQQKEDEKLGVKLRRKGDILNALRAGGILILTAEGLYRVAKPDGSQNRVSKRRAASFVAQGLMKLVKKEDDGSRQYLLDPEAEKEANGSATTTPEPKSAPADVAKSPAQNPKN